MIYFQPWQVRWVDLDPAIGREEMKTRSAVIISTSFHLRLMAGHLATVMPVTSKVKPYEHRVPITRPDGMTLYVMTDQIRTVSSLRFNTRRPPWSLTQDEIEAVRRAARFMVDL